MPASTEPPRTYLHVIDAEMAEYAKRYGALYDRIHKAWYVQGAVPVELAKLVVTPSAEAAIVRGFAPVCTKCGADMRVVRNKVSDREFWACSNFRATGCRSYLPYAEGLAQVHEQMSRFHDHEWQRGVIRINARETRRLIVDLAQQAVRYLGSEPAAKQWLLTRNPYLSGMRPVDVMVDYWGCKKVGAALEVQAAQARQAATGEASQ